MARAYLVAYVTKYLSLGVLITYKIVVDHMYVDEESLVL